MKSVGPESLFAHTPGLHRSRLRAVHHQLGDGEPDIEEDDPFRVKQTGGRWLTEEEKRTFAHHPHQCSNGS